MNFYPFFQVGGELSNKIMYYMNPFGRVAVCGAISGYNEKEPLKGNINTSQIFENIFNNEF